MGGNVIPQANAAATHASNRNDWEGRPAASSPMATSAAAPNPASRQTSSQAHPTAHPFMGQRAQRRAAANAAPASPMATQSRRKRVSHGDIAPPFQASAATST